MKKVFGIPIVLLAIGLMVVGGATAALVSYLSNTKTVSFESESPLVMYFDGEAETETTTLTLSDVQGGEVIRYDVFTKNNADVDIQSYPATVLIAPVGTVFTGEEFTSITILRKDSETPEGQFQDVTNALYFRNPSTGLLEPFSTNVEAANLREVTVFFTGTGAYPQYTREVGFLEENEISIELNPALTPGEYTIKSCQLYETTGDCQ